MPLTLIEIQTKTWKLGKLLTFNIMISLNDIYLILIKAKHQFYVEQLEVSKV